MLMQTEQPGISKHKHGLSAEKNGYSSVRKEVPGLQVVGNDWCCAVE